MNWLQVGIDAARALNHRVEVQDQGDWPGLGRLLNVTVPNGEMTSIVVRNCDDVAAKIIETIGRFESP